MIYNLSCPVPPSIFRLQVKVQQAKGLKKTDVFGQSDPFCELTTDGKHSVATKVIRKTLEPRWDETFWLLVQVRKLLPGGVC